VQKKLKMSSDVGDCGSKKYERGYGGAYGGVWQSLRLAEVAFGTNLTSVTVKMFSQEKVTFKNIL
jgi:hypothetical protein